MSNLYLTVNPFHPGYDSGIGVSHVPGPGCVAGPEGLGFHASLRSRCRTGRLPRTHLESGGCEEPEQDPEAAASVPAPPITYLRPRR